MNKVKRFTIESDAVCYGPMPLPEDEVLQRLTINSQGRVWLSRYCFGNGFRDYALKSKDILFIGKEKAERILGAIAAYYCEANKEDRMMVTDCGSWAAEIVFDTEETIADNGSLIRYPGTLHQVTQMIRDALNDQSVFVFEFAEDDSEDDEED